MEYGQFGIVGRNIINEMHFLQLFDSIRFYEHIPC